MNKSATEINLNKEQFEQLLDAYIDTIIDNMSMEDFRQYVRNDMNDYLYKCSESEVINEIEYTLSEEDLQKMITTIKED
tara:strand:+ start:251 stop:487 length:237 start_codon:yes stop_codon:yes gene_type:complete